MPKSTSSRSKNGSEVSSRSGRRRTEDEIPTESRPRDDSSITSSSLRRKSSKRDNDVEKAGWMPDSTSFSSSSRAPHVGMAAPSVASSYATAFTNEPQPFSQPPQLVRNESMTEPPKQERKGSKRDSKSGSKRESRRGYSDSDDNPRNVGRPDSERSSRHESRKSSRKESSRSFNDHDAALPQNQFPGQGPSEYTGPYRPPGHAADYYGDHGESVQSQPGVRPNPPSVIHTADQAHLMQPTTEAKPPAEPSSLGQVGAAASFFGMDRNAGETAQQSTPSNAGRNSSFRPSKSGRYDDTRPSSRSSPGPSGRVSASTTPSAIGAATAGTGTGQAAEYYAGNIPMSSPDQVGDSTHQGAPPRTQSPESYAQSSRPPKGSAMGSQSGSHRYGTTVATGLAGAAAASYLAGHSGSHYNQHPQHGAGPSSGFAVGQGQPAFPAMQQQRRQKRRGPLGKLANWFKDPDGVAEFEAYTEAIGVCRHCFDPNSSPADAPRKHHYHQHRQFSGSRHGSTARVDKTYRYSSSDDDRRRRSTATKVVAGGLAGYGAAKLGEAVFKQKYDFDDAYSLKSGRPDNRSRVSFKEEDRLSGGIGRRGSTRKLRGQGERYEKRSSRRRDSSSSSSSHGVSRGNALGVAAGATGLAIGAEALHRRRSRSRSHSPSKRKYYSKRVSPRHSYVDLSATTSGNAGLGGFFSPSSNKKKGKKSKGLFNFGNVSGSSSDADLAFGEGTVKRKPSKKGQGRQNDAKDGSTAAILSLAATGVALAAESDRRESKGRDVRHANKSAGRNPRRSSSGKIKLQDHETTTEGENDNAWEDASSDTSSSVDNVLAYGSRASAAQSRESLQGTDKWDWRWGPRKEKRKEKLHRQSSGNFDAAATGLAGAGIGAMVAGVGSTPQPLLRHLDPVPTSDLSLFDPRRSSAISGISPLSGVASPEHFATPSSVPLQQPQPMFPVAAVPDKFGRLEDVGRYTGIPHAIDEGRLSQREVDRKTRSRRDSSPARLPSRESRSTVSFDVPVTTAKHEIQERDDDLTRRSQWEDKERRKSADFAISSKPDKDADPKQSRRSSDYDRREAEIEAELQRLYEEERKRKDPQRNQDDRSRKVEAAGVTAAAVAVGAGVTTGIVSKNEKRSSSSEDTTPRRKSIMKKGKERGVSPQGDTQQERIARMAAQRVRSTPLPVYEDYQAFFVPAEIAEHVKEHNEESAHRDGHDPHVVEIVPGALLKKKDTFDSFNYRPFGIDPDDDPTVHPWPVPMLGLVEPTPPVSRTQSLRSTPNPSPKMEPVKEAEEDEDDIGERLERRSSRITWGDDDINIYEAMTPEWERSDFIPDLSDQVKDSSKVADPPLEMERERPRSGLSRVYTIDDDAASVSPVDKADNGLPGAFPATESGDNSPPQVNVPPAEGERVSTPTMADLNDMLRSSPFYQQRFSEAVGDPEDLDRPEQQTGRGFIEDREFTETPKDDVPRSSIDAVDDIKIAPAFQDTTSSPRLSKSERRRMERAAALEDTTPAVAATEPQAQPSVSVQEVQPANPGSEHAFDYLVDEDGKSLPPASVLGVAASTVLSDGRKPSTDAPSDTLASSVQATSAEVAAFSKPKRSSTLDHAGFDEPRSRSKTDYASDPEDWERSGSKTGKDMKRLSKSTVNPSSNAKLFEAATGAGIAAAVATAADDDFYSSEKPRRRKSKRESGVSDNDDVQSVASSPATTKHSEKRSRRKSGRESEVIEDDDTRSVASSPADSRKTNGKAKDADKKSSSGIWSSIFGGPKSDVSTSSKMSSKATKSGDRTERDRSADSGNTQKRRSRGEGLDDITSATSDATRESRRDSAPFAQQAQNVFDIRPRSVDDNFIAADEAATGVPNANGAEEPSFLVERPEMPQPTDTRIPMATDGVSGLYNQEHPPDQALGTTTAPTPLVRGDATAREVRDLDKDSQSAITDYFATDPTLAVPPASNRISGLKTTELPSSHIIGTSPAAVPFNTRRFPVSPATPRASWSSPIASPSTPLTAPRSRQARPKSTEFRSAREFRPLYLVQKSLHEKSPNIATAEVEEDLPSLPSSRTSSAHPSMENLRGEAERQEYFDIHQMTPEQFRERGRRHSTSYWRDEPRRRVSPDYLDSRSATPVPADFSRALDFRGKRERPKYEFHSPSELLQDPALNPELPEEHQDPPKSSSPLPSVVSTENEDFMSARSGSPTSGADSPDFEKQRSRRRSRSESTSRRHTISAVSLRFGGGAALAVAATEALSEDKDKTEKRRNILESGSLYGGDVIPSAAGPPAPPPPPPPPPSIAGPANFAKKSSKRSVTEPAGLAASTVTNGRPAPPKEGGMGSIAAMVAARANQLKEKKAQKSLPVAPVLNPLDSALDGQAQTDAIVATETTAEPESTAYEEIASAEALTAVSRAVRGADTQEPSKAITGSEATTRGMLDPKVEAALEIPAKELKQIEGLSVSATPQDSVEAIPVAREFINSPTAHPIETPAEEADDWAFPIKKSKKDKRKTKSKNISEIPASQETAEPSIAVEEIDAWAITPSKKSKRDKQKGKRQESLTPLDISEAGARDVTGEGAVALDDDQPLTAISTEKHPEAGWQEPVSEQERDVLAEEVLPEAMAVEESLEARDVSVEDQPVEVGDLLSLEHLEVLVNPTEQWTTEGPFGAPTGLSEHGSRLSFPWDDGTAPAPIPEDAPHQLEAEHQLLREGASEEAAAAFVPSAEQLNKPGNDLGALEEAFERALRARRLPEALSREDALGWFLPKRNNAPFIAKGGLTPIVGSEASSPADKSPPPEQERVPHLHAEPKRPKKDKKRSRKLDSKGSSLRQMSLSEEEGDHERETTLPGNQDATQIPTALTAGAALVAADLSSLVAEAERDGPNSSGTDLEVRQQDVEYQALSSEPPLEPAVEATRAITMDFDKVVEEENPIEADAEEFSWGPVSKKDKKKKKKTQTSTPAEVAMPSDTTPLETPSEPVETPREQIEDDWAAPTSKKAKKGKKDKKKQTFDWIDDAALDGEAAAVMAGAAIGASASKDEKEVEIRGEADEMLEDSATGEGKLEQGRELDQPPTDVGMPTIPNTIQAEEPNDVDLDDFASVPSSKKDKKKKKKGKSTAFHEDNVPTGTSAPDEENPVLSANVAVSSMTTAVGDVVTFSVPETKDETIQEMPVAVAETSIGAPVEVDMDEWSEPPKKQSKKQKRDGKKGKSIGLADLPDEDSLPQTPAEREPVQHPVQSSAQLSDDVAATDQPLAQEMENKDDLPLLTAIASASAQRHHESAQHQDFLAEAFSKVSSFPSKPEDMAAPGESQGIPAPDVLPAIESLEDVLGQPSPQEDPTAVEEPVASLGPERTTAAWVEPPTYPRPEDIYAIPSEPVDPEKALGEDILFQPSKKSKKDKKKAKKKSQAFNDWDESPAEPAVPANQSDDTTSHVPIPEVHEGIEEAVEQDIAMGSGDMLSTVEELDIIKEAVAADFGKEREPIFEPVEESANNGIKEAVAAAVGSERRDMRAPVEGSENVPIKEAMAIDVGKELQDILEPVEELEHNIIKDTIAADVGKEREEILDPVEEPMSVIDEPQMVADVTPAETAAEDEDQSAWTPKKKSKKDKQKAKKRTSTFADEVDIASPAPEAEPPLDSTNSSSRELDAGLASGTLAGAAAAATTILIASDAPVETPPKEQEDDFAWQPTSKKSKKDKKKRKSLAWADEEVSTPATQDSDLISVDEAEAAALSGTTMIDSSRQLPISNVIGEPDLGRLEDAAGFSSKETHDVAAAMFQAAQTVEEPAGSIKSKVVPDTDLGSVVLPTEIEEPALTIEAATEADVQHLETEDQALVMKPIAIEEPEEPSWATATKKSKKDKKKKRGSAFDFESPAEGTSTPEPEIETPASDDVAERRTVAEPAVAEDDWAFTSKKSKKDKKKKQGSTFELDSPAERISTAEPEVEMSASGVGAEEKTVTVPAVAEDDWGFASKKTKKEKKKKQKSTLTFDEAIEEAATPGPAWEAAQIGEVIQPAVQGERTIVEDATRFVHEAESTVRETEPVVHEAPTEEKTAMDPEPLASDILMEQFIPATTTPEVEEEWGFSTKKSKKDKKKTRASQLALEENFEPPTPEPEVGARAAPEIAARDVVMEDITPAPVAEPKEEWESSTRKSKKDKKKKSRSTFALDEAEETSTPGTETPVIASAAEPEAPAEPEVAGKEVAVYEDPSLAVDESEEWAFSTTKSRQVKKKKASAFALEEPESTSTPSTDTRAVEPSANSERQVESELTPREISVEGMPAADAVVAQELAFSSRKSKKDKKKKAATSALHELESTYSPDTGTPAIEAATIMEPELTAREIPIEETTIGVTAIEPEEWTFSGKKSKKDKKKKRNTALAWDDSTPAESDVPMEAKEVRIVQEPETFEPEVGAQPPIEAVTEPLYIEPESVPDSTEQLGSVEPARDVVEAPAVAEPLTDQTPAASKKSDAAPASYSLILDKRTAKTVEPEPEAEKEDWEFSTKKSKRDKKKPQGSALVRDDTLPSISDPILPVIEPEIADAISEPVSSQKQVEPEPELEAWTSLAKKNRKDKKKQKSILAGSGHEGASGRTTPITPMETEAPIATLETFDKPIVQETSGNMDTPAVEEAVESVNTTMREAPLIEDPAPFADVSTTLLETPIEDTPEDFWGFSSKKTKKDKKKKRQSTLQEGSAAEDSSFVPTPAEPATLEQESEAATQEPQREHEPGLPTTERDEMAKVDAPIDWADNPWGLSTKKSKKEKKTNKLEMFEKAEDIQVKPETSREIVDSQHQSSSAQEKAADLVAMAFADDRKERSRSRSRSREAPAISVEVSAGSPAAESSSPFKLGFSESATPVEAVEDERGFSTTKSKKDKKKKRQSTFDDIVPETKPKDTSSADIAGAMMMEAFSVPEGKDVTVEDQPTNQPVAKESYSRDAQSIDLPMPNARTEAAMSRDSSTPAQVKDIGDYQFGSASPILHQALAVKPELALTQTLKQLEEAPIQAPIERYRDPSGADDWYAPATKSKKDKKKKKHQPGLQEAGDQYSADVSARTTDERIGPIAVEEKDFFEEAAPDEEPTVGRKKSKKDKKRQKSQLAWEEEAESTARSSGTVKEPQEPGDHPSMRERSSSLKASVLPIPEIQGAVLMSQPSPTEKRSASGYLDTVPPMAPEPPSAISQSLEPDRRLHTEPAEPTPTREDDWYSTPKKGKKSKKDKKATRASTLEFQDAAIAAEASSSAKWQEHAKGADEGYPTSSHNTEDIRMDDSDGSRVSESTRERRRRRRSPQAYNGEELPDLPRPLATPPPEHDDIMDTALGVAVGIGFGRSEGERAPRPHSPTPTKTRGDEPSWSFDKVATAIPHELREGNRDSGVQFDSPTLESGHPRATRDSGYVPSPATGHAWGEEAAREDNREYLRPARPQSPTSSTEDVTGSQRQDESTTHRMLETPAKRQPSPIESTTKDRSSVVFKSSPAASSPYTPHIDTSVGRDSLTDIRRSPSVHGHHLSGEQLRSLSPFSRPRRISDPLASNPIHDASAVSVDRSVFSPPPYPNISEPLSPPKSPLHSIPEHRPSTDFATAAALGATGMGAASLLARDSTSSPTNGARSLGRSRSRTSSVRDLRGSLTSPGPYNPRDGFSGHSSGAVGEARALASGEAPATIVSSARAVQGGGVGGMADIYDGYGAHPGTPTSPSRPPSVTRRRSMQQIQDLQTRVEQLASENRMLAEAKIIAERHLEEFHLDRNRAEYATEEALREAELKVQERDEEIDKLKEEVEEMAQKHDEHSRSMGLGTAAGLGGAAGLAAGAMAGGSWEEDKQELEDLRSQHHELSTGVDQIVRREVDTAVAEKTMEIERLQNDLTLARQGIKELQSQILRQKSQAGGDSIIVFRDEDYFDQKCQELCQHVQGWVLRFSKFSDSRVCRSTNEVRDEKVVDRFDNAILDGSEVDTYLGDRVKRRDVFMSVVMTMVWEYVFTRYLFGMDREQRQKLKQLEKNLGEVGSKAQVGQWRAMTLTLLSKREGFRAQCESDTQAVSYEILGTLSKFLPPPANLQEQILESLRGVLRLAVQVSVEMRCQGAEYIMLPPLQPEYDTNGDLMRKVFFNASLMNERSGETKSNEELQEQGAVVRIVLFPLVVKKGGEEEGEEEEIVVCPAQVLVARVDKGKKVKRSSSGKSRATSGRSEAAVSMQSLGAMSGVEMGGNGDMI